MRNHKGVKVRVINMNPFEVECERTIDINDYLLSNLKSVMTNLEQETGLSFKSTEILVKDSTLFYKYILGQIYPNFEIIDNQRVGNGEPDFILFSKSQPQTKIYVEVKRSADGLRYNQFNWMLNNMEKQKIKILFFQNDYCGDIEI